MPDEITPDEVATTEPTTPADDAPLGESGEKALAVWKQRAKAAEADAKRATQLEAELAELRQAQMSDQDKALDQARTEAASAARAEVLDSVNRRLFAAELRAATSGKLIDQDLLTDPDVAVRLLGLDEVPVTETGDIDAEAISAAVDAFIEAKPHLSASATRAATPIAQGARLRSEPEPGHMMDGWLRQMSKR